MQSPGAAVGALSRHPQLLAVDLPAQQAALVQTLGAHGLDADAAAQIIASAPELLAVDAPQCDPVLSLLTQHGFQVRHGHASVD